MGYYIETDSTKGKAEYIQQKYNGRFVNQAEARSLVDTMGVIVVVDNGFFEAAAFAYDLKEFDEFTRPQDMRRKDFVVIERDLAKNLTSFKK